MRAGVCVRGVGGFVLMGKAEAGGATHMLRTQQWDCLCDRLDKDVFGGGGRGGGGEAAVGC